MRTGRVFRGVLLLLGGAMLLAGGCDNKGKTSGGGEGGAAAEHAHGEGHGPHDGTIGKLTGGHGYVELKLHDDKGDLELWIARDEAITAPIDLPLDAQPVVTFVDEAGKTATLGVRNREHNEDENGTPNLREGRTNYFIFPGDSGQSAEWLMGKDFESKVVVRFEHDGQTVESEPFVLAPHGHTH